MYRRAMAQGLRPQFAPREAEWGEHYFHIADPDGHELSFAKPSSGKVSKWDLVQSLHDPGEAYGHFVSVNTKS